MTNHRSLAIVIPMLLAASNGVNALDIFNKHGSKLELYGSINPNHELSHGFLSTKITAHNDDTNAILGLKGKINITDELSSYATIEYKTDFSAPEELLNKQQSNSVRLGYAGFKYGDWGSIDYGRNYGIFHDVQSLTNRAPYINKDSVFNYNDNYMIGRNNSLLTYRNNNLFGLANGISLALQYQDQSKNRAEHQQNGTGWGASLKYESDVGLTAIGSCFSSERSELDQNNQNQKLPSAGAYGLGFKYDANDIYIAAFYGEARNLTPSSSVISQNTSPNEQLYINKTQNIEAIAEYNFHSGFHPSLSYLDSKGQNSNTKNSSGHQDLELAKEINISTRYEFNKNISTYMNYKINLLKSDNFIKKNNIPTDNTIGAGIVYHF
ncbi:OmpF-like porin [Buchnera aphidicola str. Ak (Acyrthosiphon kondoi)]|uniref:OmpF-like porin n=1 Tax=Buchnera aphidicola str. Ak (Acyrthosiphon kondoi) TaxID=1005090 RepID=G2LN67_9GAMM|nr:porin [Buchnera aphidicola]AEO08705.1 OmpF-like porin [Buchnera aphidicola str. Ak (Acyrthosiphon kondoi)]